MLPAKSLDPDLQLLHAELERLDYVVVQHGDHICVRLPLISSVRIRHTDDRFRFVPQFGPFRRSGGLLFTSGVSAAAVAGSVLAFGAAPLTLLVGFLGMVALAHDACRFILTEGCLTRLQQLIASSGVLSSRSKAPPVGFSAGQRALLSERSPATVPDQRSADQSSVVR
ncbi:MAG TPA: hypothetical protein VGO75_10850 [Gemmatimonadaceae bacterium]|jgi:hypothetical protein|nr:hypothetical protein [Gemmatimonadaceae bacterium]